MKILVHVPCLTRIQPMLLSAAVCAKAVPYIKRAKIWERKSPLVVAEQCLLVLLLQTCCRKLVASVFIWLGAEPHLVPLLSFYMLPTTCKLVGITAMMKGGPMHGKNFWRGQQACFCSWLSLGIIRLSCYTCVLEITASLQTQKFSPWLPAKFHWEKRNGEGEEAVRKTIVFPGEKK